MTSLILRREWVNTFVGGGVAVVSLLGLLLALGDDFVVVAVV